MLSILNRVVVHPKYRTIGLGHKLVRETLPLAGTQYVESIAVMAKYNPFFEKAGMQKIVETPPNREAVKILKILKSLGFNEVFLRSPRYVMEKLSSLTSVQLDLVRAAFKKYKHPRFLKEFGWHDVYGKPAAYEKNVKNADFEKLTKLIGTCGVMLQTKVYLFWSKS